MKIKETILGIGIAIIFVLFVVFGIKAFSMFGFGKKK